MPSRFQVPIPSARPVFETLMTGAVELRIRGRGNFALLQAGQPLLSASQHPPRVSHLHSFDTEAGCDRKLVYRCVEGVEGALDARLAAFPD